MPRKNMKLLGDRPLIDWTIATALDAKGIDRVIVSTDDEEIANIARNSRADVPFLRPDFLANDGAKSIDVVLHTLDWLKENGEEYDAVCLLQPTTPFRSVELLQKCIDTFRSEDYTSLISVTEVPHQYHPNWAFVDTGNGRLEPAQGVGSIIPRRQELPGAYVRDGAVYLTRTQVLREKDFFGKKMGYVLNKEAGQVNIDTMEDWNMAENILG